MKKRKTTLLFWFGGLLLLALSGIALLIDPRYDLEQMLRIVMAPDAKTLSVLIAKNHYSGEFLRKCLILDCAFAAGYTIWFLSSAKVLA